MAIGRKIIEERAADIVGRSHSPSLRRGGTASQALQAANSMQTYLNTKKARQSGGPFEA